MTEILTPVKTFWPQGLRCQSGSQPDDQNRVNLLRQVRNPERERSRNPNREVWESPSVYGGEDVKDRDEIEPTLKAAFLQCEALSCPLNKQQKEILLEVFEAEGCQQQLSVLLYRANR